MTLQEWIYHWEEGAGAKVVKAAAAVLAFVAVAVLFDALAYESFSSEEAMETAQLARNLSRGKGYTTQTIRPLSIYLLRREAAAGQAAAILDKPVPDLSTPPAYPLLLAGLMAALPFNFVASQNWYLAPERWIAVFNQVLFFVAVLLLFQIARRLFDARVAWLSAVLFAGSNLFWKFTISGLSTLWLMLVFLASVLCLVHLQERERARRAGFGSVALAGLTGVCIGVGALSRYAFMWMIIPVVIFIGCIALQRRATLCAVAGAAFLLVFGPWIARNVVLSGTCFGTASYALLEQAPPFEEDTMERSFDPQSGLRRMAPLDVVDKFFSNAREMWLNQLPRLGGNWVSAFFLVGLLVPFRDPALGRVRIFVVCSLALLFVVQAAGQTHLSGDSSEINSENLLALLAPLVFMYGVALFYTLLDQLHLVTFDARGAAVVVCILVASAPLLISLVVGARPALNTPYSPLFIQTVARFMRPVEFMISDIPAAVAWYGDRPCGWLPLDDDREFNQFNSLKPIKAVYLTQRTTDSRFLTQMMANQRSWGHFVVECEGHGEVPTGFPLTNAPMSFLPDQMLLSDRPRWRMPPPNP
ncbi:MAG TPA: glycosyltransferase family 39 protein [Verrucomicrobiae bacterium]|nr:glycosyltransferase family 39 protein [Verrucomicrobiae bacterium]